MLHQEGVQISLPLESFAFSHESHAVGLEQRPLISRLNDFISQWPTIYMTTTDPLVYLCYNSHRLGGS